MRAAGSLAVRYAFDDDLRRNANAQGRNYWYSYVAEILSRLGASAGPFPLRECANRDALAEIGALVLGDFRAEELPEGAAAALKDWIEAGGVLIGFATEGLDSLFGIENTGRNVESGSPWSISAYYELIPSPVTENCRAPIEPAQKLIILSPVRLVRLKGGHELARLYLCDPQHPGSGTYAIDALSPAIAGLRLGRGHAFYFAFNVAQTMWIIQQGRPVDKDYDGDGYLRVSDACVIGENSRAVPYTDPLHFLLANMIGRRPVPMIHTVPPRDGRVAPAVLFFGGDDEAAPENQLAASNFMAERGLPYHINVMPKDGRFAITPEEERQIRANGHEIALHYNFMDGFTHPSGYAKEDVARQASLFRARFGRDSVCTVMHWVRWIGWAEPARWIAECGGRADNSFIGWTSPPLNPVNTIGFAFGSAFPRHFWDDAAHQNVRLEFIELPIVAYEVGYSKDAFFPEKIREALGLAVRYHLTFDFFYHPVYLAKCPTCRQAIEELIRLMKEMPVPPALMGPDALALWWDARSRASIRNPRMTPRGIACEAECGAAEGFVLKIPTGNATARGCIVDGITAPFEAVREFGQWWAYVPLPQGSHAVEFSL